MSKLGFDEKLVELVMQCVRSVSYSFLINREVKERLISERGIRQGDPLFPYLFVICVHALQRCFVDLRSESFSKVLEFAGATCLSLIFLCR